VSEELGAEAIEALAQGAAAAAQVETGGQE